MCPPIDDTRLAAIDVGSNSVKMLAADISAASITHAVGRGSVTVRLQSGLSDGILNESALRRAEDAIAALAEQARTLGATRVEAFGTSALRDAKNSGELIKRVWNRCGVRLRVVSGEEEAQSAYAAAADTGREIVFNPGGGSSEMILGEDGEPLRSASAHIGAVSLKEKAEGLTAEDCVSIATDTLFPAWQGLQARPDDALILSGGTATCATAVLLGLTEYDPQKVEGYTLRLVETETLMARLFALSFEERCKIPGLGPERADILPYGLAICICRYDLTPRVGES